MISFTFPRGQANALRWIEAISRANQVHHHQTEWTFRFAEEIHAEWTPFGLDAARSVSLTILTRLFGLVGLISCSERRTPAQMAGPWRRKWSDRCGTRRLS
jgi:hypothetical protein